MTIDTKSLILGSLLTLLGMLISHLYHIYEKRKTKHEKAIEVAREYESILNSGSFSVQDVLSSVMSKLEIKEKLSFLDEDKRYITFDKTEAIDMIGDDLIKKYQSFVSFSCTSFIKILAMHHNPKSSDERLYSQLIRDFDDKKTTSQNITSIEEILVGKYSFLKNEDEESRELEIMRIKRDLRIFIEILVDNFNESYNIVRNKFEWLSMLFVTGIAESDTVYQSLHQSFFSIVKCFYIDIACLNDKEVYDRYYVNMTNLFKIWKNKYNRKKAKFNKQKKKNEKLISYRRQRV